MMLGEHVALRLDFRDYITPFPKKVIAPAPLGTARGIHHMFTPMAGLSWTLYSTAPATGRYRCRVKPDIGGRINGNRRKPRSEE